MHDFFNEMSAEVNLVCFLRSYIVNVRLWYSRKDKKKMKILYCIYKIEDKSFYNKENNHMKYIEKKQNRESRQEQHIYREREECEKDCEM